MQVKILEDHQIEKIHLKTLKILENTGVNVPHAEILLKFEGCGAIVNHKSNLVKIPSNLVMELLSKAAKTFTMYGRDLSKTYPITPQIWMENKKKLKELGF